MSVVGLLRKAHAQQAAGTLITRVVWNYSPNTGNMVSGYAATSAAAASTPVASFTTSGADIPYYWIRPGDYAYTCAITFNTQNTVGNVENMNGEESIAAPVVSNVVIRTGEFRQTQMDDDDDEGGDRMDVMVAVSANGGFAFRVAADVTLTADYAGRVSYFQTVYSRRSCTKRDGTVISLDSRGYVLDSNVPYGGWKSFRAGETKNVSLVDAPFMKLPKTGFKQVKMQDDFVTYLMYEPTAPADLSSIAVCLGKVTWKAHCQADQESDNGAWVLSGQDSSASEWTEDQTLPVWAGNIQTFAETFNGQLAAAAPGVVFPSHISAHPSYAEGRRLYSIAVAGAITPELRQNLTRAAANRLGPYQGSPAGFRAWMPPDRVQPVQGVAGVSRVFEPAATDRYPQPKGGRIPDFANETEYYVSVAPVSWAASPDDADFWGIESDMDAPTLQDSINAVVAPLTVTCSDAFGYGRFHVQFPSAPGEPPIRAIAGLPFVDSVELKQHFSPGPGPVGPIYT